MAGTRAQFCDRCGSGTLHPGQVLGVVCHCFPAPLDVPTFAARCPLVITIQNYLPGRPDARGLCTPGLEHYFCFDFLALIINNVISEHPEMRTVCSFQRLVYIYLRTLKGTCRKTAPLMSLTVRFSTFLQNRMRINIYLLLIPVLLMM